MSATAEQLDLTVHVGQELIQKDLVFVVVTGTKPARQPFGFHTGIDLAFASVVKIHIHSSD